MATTLYYRYPDGQPGWSSFEGDPQPDYPDDVEVLSLEQYEVVVAEQEALLVAYKADLAQRAAEQAATALAAKRSAAQRLMRPPVKMTAAEAAAVVGLPVDDLEESA